MIWLLVFLHLSPLKSMHVKVAFLEKFIALLFEKIVIVEREAQHDPDRVCRETRLVEEAIRVLVPIHCNRNILGVKCSRFFMSIQVCVRACIKVSL